MHFIWVRQAQHLERSARRPFSVLVALWVIRRRKTGISLKKSDFKIETAVIGQVLKIGIPVALQDGFIQVAFMIITVIANSRGVSDAAGQSALLKK